MPTALLMLLEQIVMSDVVQEQAWSLLRPHILAGTMPTDAEIAQVQKAVDDAHAALQSYEP